MDKNGLKDLVNAIGSLGEMCGLFRASLLKCGFTREEALELTKTYLQVTLSSANKGGEEKEDGDDA